MGLAPEKLLLKWMNFHLKKVGYEKQVTNFSSDVKVLKLGLATLFFASLSYLRFVNFLLMYGRTERHMHTY